MLTAEKVRGVPGVYKYVQLASGEFLFAEVTGEVHHEHLVKEGEHAISAGNIVVTQDYFRYLQYGSYTLKLEKKDDQIALEAALNLPGKHSDKL